MESVSKAPDIWTKIEEAWKLRHEGDLEGFSETVNGLETHLGSTDLELQLRVQIYALLTSRTRMHGATERAMSYLEIIEKSEELSKLPFEYYFQKGLNFMALGNHNSAYTYFVKAESLAAKAWDRLAVKWNIIFCLNHMGFPEPEHVKPWDGPKNLRDQYEVYLTRQKIRNGDLTPPEDCSGEQNQYLNLWLKSIPYSRYYDPECIKKSTLALSRNQRKRTTFRAALLLEQVDGATTADLRDLADGLYLATWRWLTNPDMRKLKYVFSLLDAILRHSDWSVFTVEDLQLFSCSLLWLKLFCPKSKAVLFSEVLKIPLDKTESYPLFEYERALIALFYNWIWREGGVPSDVFSKFKKVEHLSHDLYKLKDIKSLESSSQLYFLASQLHHLRGGFKKNQFTVHMRSHQILSPSLAKVVTSAPLCRALEVLSRQPVISFGELLGATYGVYDYEEVEHQPRLFNLMARLKKIMPSGFSLKSKNQVLYVSGPWNEITIIGEGIYTEQMRIFFRTNDWPKKRGEQPSMKLGARKHSEILKALSHQRKFSRSDVESILETSKSSAHRIIRHLLKKGCIKKSGTARNSFYEILV